MPVESYSNQKLSLPSEASPCGPGFQLLRRNYTTQEAKRVRWLYEVTNVWETNKYMCVHVGKTPMDYEVRGRDDIRQIYNHLRQ